MSPDYQDEITPLKAVTEQPFWIPSQSLQLKMLTHAHTLIEVLNQVRAVCTRRHASPKLGHALSKLPPLALSVLASPAAWQGQLFGAVYNTPGAG